MHRLGPSRFSLDARRTLFILFALVLFLVSCSTPGDVQLTYQIAFIQFTLHGDGTISVDVSPSVATPIGTFGVSYPLMTSGAEKVEVKSDQFLLVIRHWLPGKRTGGDCHTGSNGIVFCLVDDPYMLKAGNGHFTITTNGLTVISFDMDSHRALIDASHGDIKTIEIRGKDYTPTPDSDRLDAATATALAANATAQADSTATALAYASATAVVASATAQAQANPYPPFKGNLVFDDAMQTDASGTSWDSSVGCQFMQKALYVDNSACAGPTLQGQATVAVDMRITDGGCGGIRYDVDTKADEYLFEVCLGGVYHLRRETSDHQDFGGWSRAIHPRPGDQNTLAVTTDGDTLYFYVNHQRIAALNVDSYTSFVPVLVADDHLPGKGEAAFNHMKIWTH